MDWSSSLKKQKLQHDRIETKTRASKSGIIRVENPESLMPDRGIEIDERKRKASIDVPAFKDILLGRGKDKQDHPGNFIMRQLVKGHKEHYFQLPRNERRPYAERVVDELLETGARFLTMKTEKKRRRSLPQWEEAERSKAFEKVFHLLREKPKNNESEEGEHCESGEAPAVAATSTAATAFPQNEPQVVPNITNWSQLQLTAPTGVLAHLDPKIAILDTLIASLNSSNPGTHQKPTGLPCQLHCRNPSQHAMRLLFLEGVGMIGSRGEILNTTADVTGQTNLHPPS